MVGLSNVDNTSGLNKPFSTTVQTVLNSNVSQFHVAFRAFGNGSVIRSYGKYNITTTDITVTGVALFSPMALPALASPAFLAGALALAGAFGASAAKPTGTAVNRRARQESRRRMGVRQHRA